MKKPLLTIGRVVLRRRSGPVTLEVGGEAALNILDSQVGLERDGVPVPLPAADIRVEEKRGEAFATASWQASSELALEGGLRAETSKLTQSGDSGISKRLSFLKPRALAIWSPDPQDQFRLWVERDVGRGADPSEIAALIALLVGPHGRFFCGSVLLCDGGTEALLHPDDWPSRWG